jgi:hypothetical protein
MTVWQLPAVLVLSQSAEECCLLSLGAVKCADRNREGLRLCQRIRLVYRGLTGERRQTSEEKIETFYVVRTVHFGMILSNNQRNAQVFNLFICFLLPYMFRAFFSPSSEAGVQLR